MSKKPRRRAFPEAEQSLPAQSYRTQESIVSDDRVGGVFGFFRDIGVRETIESIIVAIVLALMFRAYEAEAFIIPTGSMAPSLQGQHIDLECEQCGFDYRSNASEEGSSREQVDSTYCPICQYRTRMKPRLESDHKSHKGDRILVNKFIYDFEEPERFDVIVFKNPNDGKQNYIKRLIGLPGDNILIENGDIYLIKPQPDGTNTKEIARKPSRKIRNTLQVVDDTFHIGDKLKAVEWPSRWQEFDGTDEWETQRSNGNPTFHSPATDQTNWIRYRHFQPLKKEWPTIEDGQLPDRFADRLPTGRLIGDQYAYNDGFYRNEMQTVPEHLNLGLHWVGDIGLDGQMRVDSPQGVLSLDVVEGGAHFTCEIDVATGQATLRCDDSNVETKVTFRDAEGNAVQSPVAKTNLKGKGDYHVEYVNADDRIHLWINNKLIEFDAPDYTRTGIPVPTYQVSDPGDAEPIGVGAKGLDLTLERLQIKRDIYYTSVKSVKNGFGIENNYELDNETGSPPDLTEQYQRTPELWSKPSVVKFFQTKKGRTEPMFELRKGTDSAKDQFLPMGDNSPRSLDGRVWSGDKYVERDLLIGRAMLIYWPHAKNEPIPFFPNFERMGFIR